MTKEDSVSLPYDSLPEYGYEDVELFLQIPDEETDSMKEWFAIPEVSQENVTQVDSSAAESGELSNSLLQNGSQATGWFPYPDSYVPQVSQTGLAKSSSFYDTGNGGLGPSATCFSDYGGNVVTYPVNYEYGSVSNLDHNIIDSKFTPCRTAMVTPYINAMPGYGPGIGAAQNCSLMSHFSYDYSSSTVDRADVCASSEAYGHHTMDATLPEVSPNFVIGYPYQYFPNKERFVNELESRFSECQSDGASRMVLDRLDNGTNPYQSLAAQRPVLSSEHPTVSQTFDNCGGLKLQSNKGNMTIQAALQDLSQPTSEASPPDSVLAVPLLRHQGIALAWMSQKETSGDPCFGGILADDQGLGKTVSTVALILSKRSPPSLPCEQDGSCKVKEVPAGGTLIVCPASLMRQWADEIRNKVTREANLSVLVYHGGNRTKDPNELAKYDVVITTYAIVCLEVPDEEKCTKKRKRDGETLVSLSRPLAEIAWFRVVADEAQNIKNHTTQVSRACCGLLAKYRWCLSGTPIQNSIDDLYSYFRFLKYYPYASYQLFRDEISNPVTRNPEEGYQMLQGILKKVMLRRTKGTILDGKPVISLPPKSIELRKVDFTKEERDFYSKLECDSRDQFKEYAEAGTVQKNYGNILLMLLRLRQACGHPLLVSTSSLTSSVEVAKKLPFEKKKFLLNCLEASLAVCGICNGAPEDALVSACGHIFCKQCICEYLTGDNNQCPLYNCKAGLEISSLFSKATLGNGMRGLHELDAPSDSTPSDPVESTGEPSIPFRSSKIKAALEVLQSLNRPQSPMNDSNQSSENGENQVPATPVKSSVDSVVKVVSEKAIVFSQWTKMLDLLETSLKSLGIQYRRFDGKMSVAARDEAVQDFNTLPEVTVMIMSLKAACLGLNLVAASHVLILDLWWNPTTEDQAIDRAHRIGQTRPVKVVRFTVKDTVEDRILALQQRKRMMVASAYGEGKKGSNQSNFSLEDIPFLLRVHECSIQSKLFRKTPVHI